MSDQAGRRERKKAQTRRSLTNAAHRLFLERGYERVSVREVAEAADVSLTTLFSYFPTKESLVFEGEEEISAALQAAVRNRAPEQSVLGALRVYVLRWANEAAAYPHVEAFARMIEDTPALQAYARRMWLRHEPALAAAMAEAVGSAADDVGCIALARFVLEIFDLAPRHRDPAAAVETIFTLLEEGWVALYPPTPAPAV